MAKKELFSRLNLKDYNYELEGILETKDFSGQVKNLLLSMFYKLEVGYKDYAMIKPDTLPKETIMESILYVIKNKCNKIDLIKPTAEEKQHIIWNENGEIQCYPTEESLLQAILEISKKEFLISEEYISIKEPIQEVLIHGYEMNTKELLTNFDGWSWNNNFEKHDDIYSFIIYQNLRLLVGNSFLYEWKRDRRKEKNYLEELKNIAPNFFQAFCKFCILYSAQNKEKKKKIKKELENQKEKLAKMKNKSEFLKEIYENKKILAEKIKINDQILSDNDLLREEFIDRNSYLADEKKFFSVSNLEEELEKERDTFIEKLQEYNQILEPKNYIKKIKQIEEQIELMESVNIEKITESKIEKEQIKLQIAFLDDFRLKIEKATTKKEMHELIYNTRYYLWLPAINKKSIIRMKDFAELKEKILDISKKVITKACKLKSLVIINQDIQYNFEIMLKIIDSKIVHLEEVIVNFLNEETEIKIEIYDGEILDRTETIHKTHEKDFAIKFNKKIKILI